MRGLFIVGTDTGVGKTFVGRALCRALRERGLPVVGLKPFESACQPDPADAEALEAEAQSGLPLDLRCPYRYRAALAPAVAAEREGLKGTVAGAVVLVRTAARGRRAIVESAGGLLSPLEGERTNLDLAEALGLPVVVVAGNQLGVLNHLTLTVAALRSRGLRVAGVVLSRGAAPGDPSQESNARWARRLTRLKRVIDLRRSTTGRAARELAALLPRS